MHFLFYSSKSQQKIPTFTSKFLMALTQSLIKEISADSMLVSHLSEHMQIDCMPSTQSTTLVPAEKLWQNIFQNLKKDHEKRTAISLSTQEVQNLNALIAAENQQRKEVALTVDDESMAAILFSCGHHFTAERFVEKLQAMQLVMASSHNLRGSVELLAKFYGAKTTPMACPGCVKAAVEV